jgi:DNA helicase-2/ATP-dependent DNA helicase PcrA
MEENLFPSQLSINSRTELEEERRLFYVALTRAKVKATLSYATSRYRWGNLNYCEPSRFLEEINPMFVDRNDQKAKAMKGFENDIPSMSGGLSSGPRGFQRLSNRTVQTSQPKAPPQSSTAIEASDTSNLKAGDNVVHQRFGKGVVSAVEGTGENRKAVVEFNSVGRKQLLLRFAKLQIL